MKPVYEVCGKPSLYVVITYIASIIDDEQEFYALKSLCASHVLSLLKLLSGDGAPKNSPPHS